MSRKQKFSRSSAVRKQARAAEPEPSVIEDDSIDVQKLPPRRVKFPSSIHKVTKWYYNLLFILFVGLVVALFWYGNKFSR